MEQKVLDYSMDKFSLKGKVAIVTGGNTTLGIAYAAAFAKAGADLFIPHFTDDIDEVKDAVEREGRRIEFFKGNQIYSFINDLINTNAICTNEIILSELLPSIIHKKEHTLAVHR